MTSRTSRKENQPRRRSDRSDGLSVVHFTRFYIAGAAAALMFTSGFGYLPELKAGVFGDCKPPVKAIFGKLPYEDPFWCHWPKPPELSEPGLDSVSPIGESPAKLHLSQNSALKNNEAH